MVDKKKNTWRILYNTDKDNLPKQIDLVDVNGEKQSININELVAKKIRDSKKELIKDLGRINFMGYVQEINTFSNEQLNEQINFAINQKINEKFAFDNQGGK